MGTRGPQGETEGGRTGKGKEIPQQGLICKASRPEVTERGGNNEKVTLE